MEKTKFLAQAVHEDEICNGQLNMIKAPVGSGKTTWALRHLSKNMESPLGMVYLIDTQNGRDQIVSANSDIAAHFSDVWLDKVVNGWEMFSEVPQEDKIVVMTYAKFGAIAKKYPEFAFGTFDYIICDEIHNLPRFMRFGGADGEDKNWYEYAKTQLEDIVSWSGTTVIGLSATPSKAEEKMECKIANITVDDDVFQLETKEKITYTNKTLLLDKIQAGQKGLAYFHRVGEMQEFYAAATQRGINAICIWSASSRTHSMTQAQLQARNHILEKKELPPQYDLVIINASSETSISIFGKVDYIIVHCQDEDTQTQVRGRYRETLQTLFVLNYDVEIKVPTDFVGRDLFTEEKAELCAILNIHDSKGRRVGWTTVSKKLKESGYTLTERRYNSRRCVVISI